MAKREMETGGVPSFPGNSHKEKKESADKKVEKVVSGSVTQKKKSLGKKLAETFATDDNQSVGNYILFDILIPQAKSMISDMVSGGIEMLLFGERKSRRSNSTYRSGWDQSRVNYGGYSTKQQQTKSEPRRRTRRDINDIVFETRGDAEDVRSHLLNLIEMYDQASVADLFDMAGLDSEFVDNKWGWYDLGEARIRRVPEGYLLDLPRPVELEV